MYDEYKLVTLHQSRDENDTGTEVFAKINSVSGDEQVRAHQISVKPKWQLTVNRFEYNSEPYVKVDGEMLVIYRIYKDGDKMELYAENKLGVW